MNNKRIKEIDEAIKEYEDSIPGIREAIDEIDDGRVRTLGAIQELKYFLENIYVVDDVDELNDAISEVNTLENTMDNIYNKELEELQEALSNEISYIEDHVIDLGAEKERIESGDEE